MILTLSFPKRVTTYLVLSVSQTPLLLQLEKTSRQPPRVNTTNVQYLLPLFPSPLLQPLPMETIFRYSFIHIHQRIGSSPFDPTVSLPHAGKALSSPPLFYFFSSSKVDDKNLSLLLFHPLPVSYGQQASMKRNAYNLARTLSQL